MKRGLLNIAAAAALSLLAAACLPEEVATGPAAAPVTYQCAGTVVKAVFDGADKAVVDIGGVIYELSTTVAASGARYVTADGADKRIVFWTKGLHDALLEIDGGEAVPCKAASPSRAGIQNKEWVVEDIDHKGIIDNAHLTLAFGDSGKLSGFSGCNRYSGAYQLDGNKLIIGPLISTRMACVAPAMMEQETRFTALLSKMTFAKIREDGALELTGDAGSLLFRTEQ